ncbi:DUF1566 domain-containing protein [Amphritea sp.]|uniref:Lcl C-terminal domain-containing protein n=1 Tax=Amphritea sp. TaxID=1872502 RepID=UPI0025C39C0B|nr:DUF1566 domain-containing protein [Amphritea sp.]
MKVNHPHRLAHSCLILFLTSSPLSGIAGIATEQVSIPDTGQNRCYNNSRAIPCPQTGEAFSGQDAQIFGNMPTYQDNHNNTVSDLTTGLIWSKAVSTDKVSLNEAKKIAANMDLGGYTDWRVPNIKELYSLIDFRGYAGFSSNSRAGVQEKIPANAIPFINTDYFDFLYGASNERYMDAQWLSSSSYSSTTMRGDKTLFGVNFADGRIKGYGYQKPGSQRPHKKFYARYVRGKQYGHNDFIDNNDSTISDQATGLTWAKIDSQKALSWEQALNYADQLQLAGHQDWRLPNAKELQYIIDYKRSPDATHSAAIDPIFTSSLISNEKGVSDYPFYWTSTTHLDGPRPGSHAAYIAFGRALGQMRGEIMDVHGAGAQRSDPKTGQPTVGHGPQGDVQRIQNYVRVVRGGLTSTKANSKPIDSSHYPYNVDHTNFSVDAIQMKVSGEQLQKMSPSEFGVHFVERLDRDGDNRVSRREFDGPANRFDHHDSNGDSFLTANEAPPPPTNRRRPTQ